jgi:hypothetical protein
MLCCLKLERPSSIEWTCFVTRIGPILMIAALVGCGEGEQVSVSKVSRARIGQDAAADGTIDTVKTKKGKGPAAGLRTIKTLREGKEKD